MKNITQVMFRKFNMDIIAVFPYEIDYNGDTLFFYIDEFHGCNYDYIIKHSKPAVLSQYNYLFNRLIELGYKLELIKKRSFNGYALACKNAKPNVTF